MHSLLESLTTIALRRTIPFCYGCYAKAPAGKCQICGSDDLMRELSGVGVEYGVDWVVRELLTESLTPAETLGAFEQSVSECYPETVKIAWIEYDTASALKTLDPVSWALAHSEWLDSQVSDDALCTFDNGKTYYWTNDVEKFVERQLRELCAEDD